MRLKRQGDASVSFSISRPRLLDVGGLIATFEISVMVGDEFAEAVTFDALLLWGPYGYFVAPAGVQDRTGTWRSRTWLSRAFAKAVCARVMAELGLEEPPPPAG